jgi:hypothetical protein
MHQHGSTPELDRIQAHLSALMTYRTAADVLEQMFPIGVGNDKETMRRHTLRAGAALRDCAAIEPETRAAAIAVTRDSTFIRSCEDGERHLEVRVGVHCTVAKIMDRVAGFGWLSDRPERLAGQLR